MKNKIQQNSVHLWDHTKISANQNYQLQRDWHTGTDKLAIRIINWCCCFDFIQRVGFTLAIKSNLCKSASRQLCINMQVNKIHLSNVLPEFYVKGGGINFDQYVAFTIFCVDINKVNK